jgi:Na+-driven multidrug efflux pump
VAALVTILGYFVIGLPLSAIISFKSLPDWKPMAQINGPQGLFLGIDIALFFMNAIFFYLIFSQDWK